MDDSLGELFPLLSVESTAAFRSMAYTEHLTEGSHYLFLGTSSGRLFQVRFNCRVYSGKKREVVSWLYYCITNNSKYILLLRNVLNLNLGRTAVCYIIFLRQVFYWVPYSCYACKKNSGRLSLSELTKHAWKPHVHGSAAIKLISCRIVDWLFTEL